MRVCCSLGFRFLGIKMSSDYQPNYEDTVLLQEESVDVECEQTAEDRHGEILRPIEEGVAAEDEAAWEVRFGALMANARFWVPYHRNSAVWAFFRLRDSEKGVDVKATQMMKCIVCHPGQAESSNSRSSTRSRKGYV